MLERAAVIAPNPQDVQDLRTAIERAIIPNGCRYTTGDEATGTLRPACVIGQLLVIRGVPVTALGQIEGVNVSGIMTRAFVRDALKPYPPLLLCDVQTEWDRRGRGTEGEDSSEARKERMRSRVESWVSGAERFYS